MTRELERLEEQIRRAFEGEAWHGPSVREALADVTPEAAAARPIEGAHNIWELTLHMAGTYRLVLRRLAGQDAQLTPAEDWPEVPAPSEANWRAAIDTLATTRARFLSASRNRGSREPAMGGHY